MTSKVSCNARVILLDIEGTTTSISFVKEGLFPYILKHVETYLTSHWNEEETQDDVDALRQQADTDKLSEEFKNGDWILGTEGNREEIVSSVVNNVKWQMSLDRKTTALKQLQGHMWLDAYKNGDVKGHLFDDVAKCMEKWKQLKRTICIYSSGSVAAQKLLFTYSVDGDVTNNISRYFDTKIGAKQEKESYSRICEELEEKPQNVLFLTDILAEAIAAKEAGLQTLVMLRPGNAPLTEKQLKDFSTIKDFRDLELDTDDYEPARKKSKEAND